MIRLATPFDTDTVTALVHAAYSKWLPVLGYPPMPMEADYAALIDRQVVYVADEGDQIVGVLVIWAIENAMLIENVAVHPQAQKGGVGKLLLDFAEQKAREAGLPQIALYTNEKMVYNQDYYRKLGYVETRREVRGENRRIVWMYKVLPL